MIKLIEYTGGSFYLEILIILCILGVGICDLIVLNRRLKKQDKIKLVNVLSTVFLFAIPFVWIGYTFGRISVLNKLII